jgi:hypothetical protein
MINILSHATKKYNKKKKLNEGKEAKSKTNLVIGNSKSVSLNDLS